MPGSIPASATAEEVALPLARPWPVPRRRLLARRFVRSPAGMAGLGLTLVVSVVAVIAEGVAPYNPVLLDAPPLRPPSLTYPMGTDQLGRDIFSAVLLGARTAMTVVLGVGAISAVIGILLGALAGYRGGLVDDLVTRLGELIQSVPRFFLAILVAGYFGAGLEILILLLALTSWPFLARVVRAESLSVGNRDFVDAARSLGAPGHRIVLRHVVPNVLPPALVVVSLTASRVILLESSLSFLGLGDPEVISWGFLLNNAQGFLDTAWWMAVFPGLAIVAAVLGLNLLSDALTDLLNPLVVRPARPHQRPRRQGRDSRQRGQSAV